MHIDDIRDFCQDLREKLAKNQLLTAGLLLLILIASLGLITYHFTSSGIRPAEVKLVYFDLKSQTIQIVNHTYPDMPASPLEGTDDVFIASVYACDPKPDGTIKDGMTLEDLKANGMFIAKLEKIDPDVTGEAAIFGKGTSYRTLTDEAWHETDSPGHKAIQRMLKSRCPKPHRCYP